MQKIKKKPLKLDWEKIREDIKNNVKSVEFTPSNIAAYCWFKSQHQGWENSDISDFANQCIEYFFDKGLGAKVSVDGEKITVEQDTFISRNQELEDKINELEDTVAKLCKANIMAANKELVQTLEKAIFKFKEGLETD